MFFLKVLRERYETVWRKSQWQKRDIRAHVTNDEPAHPTSLPASLHVVTLRHHSAYYLIYKKQSYMSHNSPESTNILALCV